MSNTVNVAFVATHYPPSSGFGGVTASSYGLSAALSRRDRQRVHVLTSDATVGGRIEPHEFQRFETDSLKISPFRYCLDDRLCFSREAGALFRQTFEMCDVIHVNGVYTYPVTRAAMLARRFDKPLIIAIRGALEPWRLQQKYRKKKLFFKLLLKRLLQAADCIHVTCEAEKQSCLDMGIRGPFAVIPNGIDVSEYAALPSGKEAQDRWHVLRGKKVVLFLSRLSREKGLDMLLQIWGDIQRRYPDAFLVIAGPDDRGYEAQVRTMIEKEKLSSSVLLTGNVEGREKQMLYSRSDVFILPSYSENFGNVIAEALVCGTPVITTHGTPWQEIEQYHCGQWVPANAACIEAALAEMLSLPQEERAAMGRRGRDLIEERYTWDRAAEKMSMVYEAILQGQPIPVFHSA